MDAVKSANMVHTDVEHLEMKTGTAPEPVGTVKLLEQGDIILIPTPTNEPRDPLNLSNWRKINIVCNVSIFAATATLMASSFGAILPIVTAEYNGDPRVNDLVTLPALFIGIGNFIFVPVSHAIGRRATYLFSLTMLVACSIWCACSKSLESHIAGRVILSLAAGQAEALCPIMIQVRISPITSTFVTSVHSRKTIDAPTTGGVLSAPEGHEDCNLLCCPDTGHRRIDCGKFLSRCKHRLALVVWSLCVHRLYLLAQCRLSRP